MRTVKEKGYRTELAGDWDESKGIQKKIVGCVLKKDRLAIKTGIPAPPRTRLEKRVFARFLVHCDIVLIPLAKEVIAEERERLGTKLH